MTEWCSGVLAGVAAFVVVMPMGRITKQHEEALIRLG